MSPPSALAARRGAFSILMLAVLAAGWLIAAAAWAQPAFPPLTGRVVDNAELLSPEAETRLDAQLATLERETSDQLVVATVPDLQGYEIEEYGYQLGRAWGIGQKENDNGVILLVAPNERKVRIEVGYGLEPILTDALSSVIVRQQILPAFRDGDYERGILEGVGAIEQQLRLDPAEAAARAARVEQEAEATSGRSSFPVVAVVFILFWLFLMVLGAVGRRGRRRGSGVWMWAALTALDAASRSGGGRSGWGGGGGFGGGGGGFGGGGGGFGGGGASGGW